MAMPYSATESSRVCHRPSSANVAKTSWVEHNFAKGVLHRATIGGGVVDQGGRRHTTRNTAGCKSSEADLCQHVARPLTRDAQQRAPVRLLRQQPGLRRRAAPAPSSQALSAGRQHQEAGRGPDQIGSAPSAALTACGLAKPRLQPYLRAGLRDGAPLSPHRAPVTSHQLESLELGHGPGRRRLPSLAVGGRPHRCASGSVRGNPVEFQPTALASSSGS